MVTRAHDSVLAEGRINNDAQPAARADSPPAALVGSLRATRFGCRSATTLDPANEEPRTMGAWGTSITSDDTVSDVVDHVLGRMKRGDSLLAACTSAERTFSAELSDPDDGPLIWLALAHVQWKSGSVAPRVLERVRSDISSGNGLERWREDSKLLAQIRAALERFLAKIESPNPKPPALPKAVIRLAPFAEGDCLSVLTTEGTYTAAIVLKVNNSNPEYGANLVGSLDYLSETPPALEVFEERQWLKKNHGNWNGEPDLVWYGPHGAKTERKRFSVVGRTKIRFRDPSSAPGYTSWRQLGVQILLCRRARGV